MKKHYKLLLALSLMLVGCSSNTEEETVEKTNEATIKEYAAAYFDTFDELAEVEDCYNGYSEPTIGIVFYDMDQDEEVEPLLLYTEEGHPNSYLVYDYDDENYTVKLINYFTNEPGLDDGTPCYSPSLDMLFTFSIVENTDNDSTDLDIKVWSSEEINTVAREMLMESYSDGSYTFRSLVLQDGTLVEEDTQKYTDDDSASASWRDITDEYIVLSGNNLSDFLESYE